MKLNKIPLHKAFSLAPNVGPLWVAVFKSSHIIQVKNLATGKLQAMITSTNVFCDAIPRSVVEEWLSSPDNTIRPIHPVTGDYIELLTCVADKEILVSQGDWYDA